MNSKNCKTLYLFIVVMAFALGCQESGLPTDYDESIRSFNQPIEGELPFFRGRNLELFWSKKNPEIQNDAVQIENFSFTNQKSQSISSDQLKGKISIVNFFYTKCTGFCGLTTDRLRLIQKDLEQNQKVIFVSISVTPDIDQPAILEEFAQKHHLDQSNWNLLTGPKGEVYSLARNSFMADTKTATADSLKDFVHSESVYLLDQNLRIRGIYNGRDEVSLQNMLSDLALLN